MSSAKPLEFFFDRSLGRISAHRLREAGWGIHLIADYYTDDAQSVEDEDWIAEGCRRGWILLTKDKRIRYRRAELEALRGFLFCLSSGNLSIDETTARLLASRTAMERRVSQGNLCFWFVYEGGRLARKWP
jgi:uncharacterized protein with PIN domain